MDLVHAPYRYTTFLEANDKLGFTALKLQRVQSLEIELAAEVVFWDASGQFVVKTFEEVPLAVFEVLLAEAKKRIAAA
jgi:hypothetical protein